MTQQILAAPPRRSPPSGARRTSSSRSASTAASHPGPLMSARTLIAGAVLFALPRWRRSGRSTAVLRLREAWRPGDRARVPQRGRPVLADRVGRAAHRLRGSGNRAGDGADLLAADRAQVPPPRADRRRPHSRRRPRASSASPSSRAARRRAARWPSSGRSPSCSRRCSTPRRGIYSQLHLKGTISGPVLATGSMLAGGLILLPLAILDPPTSTPTAGAIVSLLLLALLGTALAQLAPLPGRRPLRRAPAQPRHLPAAGLRARLRSAHPRRARHGLGADRPGADPAGRRARLRVAAAAASPRRAGDGRRPRPR